MGLCNKCKWYNAGFDNAQATMNDMIIEGKPDIEYHYCPCYMYPEHIDPDTYKGDKECEFYIAK